MDKNLKNFSINELQDLIDNNLKFRDFVYSECYDRVCDFLQSEYLNDFPGRYEYSCVYATKVNLSSSRWSWDVKWSDIVSWLENVQKNYTLLYDEDGTDFVKLAELAESLQEKLDLWDLSDLNYQRIEQKVDSIKEKIESEIKKSIDLELDSCDDPDYLKSELEILCDYYFDNVYMDEDGKIYKSTRQYI